MPNTIKISELKTFDIAESLNNEQDIAAYLSIVLEDDDPALLLAALGDIARARGLTQMAKDSGVTREALYRALSPTATPRFDTITKVLHGLGLKLQVTPA